MDLGYPSEVERRENGGEPPRFHFSFLTWAKSYCLGSVDREDGAFFKQPAMILLMIYIDNRLPVSVTVVCRPICAASG
jgi:hypothetical protein